MCNTPTDKELEAFAIEEQFLLFCDVDEFTQIARAVLAKWGTPQPVVRQPLTDEKIADFVGEQYHNMTYSELKWFRLGEAAHGIKGGQHGANN